MLLMNAMKTTAAHSSKMNLMSFTQTATSQIQNLQSPKEVEQQQQQQQQVDSGTPVAASTIRSSATPETIQDGVKGPPIGGKKRKKRWY